MRNEDWCLGLTLRAALLWCDSVVVLLHACTDSSEQIVGGVMDEYPDRVFVQGEDDPKWDEMTHRQEMLTDAREIGATHIAIVDADEILTANMIPHIRDYIPIRNGSILQPPLYNLRGGIGSYHDTGLWGNRWVSLMLQDYAAVGWSGDCFHKREPLPVAGSYHPIPQGSGGVMHLWGASERRLTAKHALYKLTERLRWPTKSVADIDRMYSLWRTGDTGTRAQVPAEWWQGYADRGWLKYLDVDAEPWQIAECKRIVAVNPGIENGLDLFDVA